MTAPRSIDFGPDDFPMHLECYTVSGEVVHIVDIAEAGVLYMPPLADLYGPVGVRVTFGDGRVEDIPPPDHDR